ncbi:MAG: ammonia-forming cytochrome c nitrite reductase subunit c552, partial [Myxococcales bacterium]
MSDPTPPANGPRPRSIPLPAFIGALLLTAVAAIGLMALLTSIWTRKQEATRPFVRVAEVDENTSDPAVWGKNWPRQYDSYLRTVDETHTRYGGSEGPIPESRLESTPYLRRMFAGYAFSIDFRERRGHAYMLYDQEQTRRVTERPQPGACLHCHASVVPTWRRVSLEAQGKSLADAQGFDWPAVMDGFQRMSTVPYVQAHAELLATPDGTPHTPDSMHPGGSSVSVKTPATAEGVPPQAPSTREALAQHVGEAHPVSCVDCHDPGTMSLRVTRPGFINGIRALAESGAPVPHLPSVERWRKGNRKEPYDPNRDATRQEMRSFACGQCHVEYYCGPKMTLFFPWKNGLQVEQIEKTYDETSFPDGHRFFDWKHEETGAEVLKAQHPEFELWSQGVHARSGVACADCHMPYVREGALKVSDHWVRSPLLMVNRACQTCHPFPEEELTAR